MVFPVLHFLIGLITTALFCTAAAIAANRAPRHVLWLGLITAGNFCALFSGGANLIFMTQIIKGQRGVSDFTAALTAQGILSGLASLLILAGAGVLLAVILSERRNAPAAQPLQDR